MAAWLGLVAAEHPTLSVGLAIGHLLEPLGALRKRAGDPRALDRRRNAVERLFRRVEAWRCVLARYDQTGSLFAAFLAATPIAAALRVR